MDEVNLGSQEQARGNEQIGKAIAQMEDVTQRAAASAKESAAAAQKLNEQSAALRDIVERLAGMVGGGAPSSGETAGERRLAAVPRRERSCGQTRQRRACIHPGRRQNRQGRLPTGPRLSGVLRSAR